MDKKTKEKEKKDIHTKTKKKRKMLDLIDKNLMPKMLKFYPITHEITAS